MKAPKQQSQYGWFLSRLACFQFDVVRHRDNRRVTWRSDELPTHLQRWQFPRRKHSKQQ